MSRCINWYRVCSFRLFKLSISVFNPMTTMHCNLFKLSTVNARSQSWICWTFCIKFNVHQVKQNNKGHPYIFPKLLYDRTLLFFGHAYYFHLYVSLCNVLNAYQPFLCIFKRLFREIKSCSIQFKSTTRSNKLILT